MASAPPNVITALKTESYAAHTQHMTEIKANIANSNNIIRHSMARLMDEPSAAQAAAIQKILALPAS